MLELLMQGSKPNILFIIPDQQRYDTIAAQEFPYVDTPNLDRLIHEGICFTNEQKNLWTNPDYNAKKEELLRVLLNWRMRNGKQPYG
jgi:hypothetical protein